MFGRSASRDNHQHIDSSYSLVPPERRNAVELLQLRAYVQQLEQTMVSLQESVEAIKPAGSDVSQAMADADLRWADDLRVTESAQPMPTSSFSDAWERRAQAEDHSSRFFDLEFAESAARRWFLRGA